MSFTAEERHAYCSHHSVRVRVRDFFGIEGPGDLRAVYLAVGTENVSRHREARPVEELPGEVPVELGAIDTGGDPPHILDAARRARQFLRRTAWRLG